MSACNHSLDRPQIWLFFPRFITVKCSASWNAGCWILPGPDQLLRPCNLIEEPTWSMCLVFAWLALEVVCAFHWRTPDYHPPCQAGKLAATLLSQKLHRFLARILTANSPLGLLSWTSICRIRPMLRPLCIFLSSSRALYLNAPTTDTSSTLTPMLFQVPKTVSTPLPSCKKLSAVFQLSFRNSHRRAVLPVPKSVPHFKSHLWAEWKHGINVRK